MTNQRGFLMMYAYLAVGLVVLGLGVAVKVQSARLATSKAETVKVQAAYDLFTEKVKQEGEAAAKAAKVKEAADLANKEKADAESQKSRKSLADMYAAYRSLRDNRKGAGSGFVPAATPGTVRPDVACYRRADLDTALRGFDQGVTGLLEIGDSALADLNTSRRWAAGR